MRPPRWRRPPFGGLVLGLVFFCMSLTPSLAPRSWLLQGVVTGLTATIGYGLGVLASHLLRQVLPREPGRRSKQLAWRLLVVVGTPTAVASVVLAGRWQQQLHLRMGAEEPTQPAYLAVLAVAAVLFVGLVAAGRGLRLAARAVGGVLRRWAPPRTAALASVLLVALAVLVIGEAVVVRGLLRAADESFRALDETLTDQLPAPTSELRSGGPGSVVAWESLGIQGRRFVDRTTTVDELRAVTGRAAAEPIRVYAGMASADDLDERAALVVEELERTGAFDRGVLCVAFATGTGWVNPVSAAALEHLHAGDTAIVSMQHGYLPSWLSFLVDRERSAEAGRTLFEHVHERWAGLPIDERPALVLYGESLGSFAAESVFDDLDDLREHTDGALLVGPPSFNPMRAQLTRGRDPGSPERLPVVDGGRAVRFASDADDLRRPDGPWREPRVAYLLHGSDPVVWWSPRLAAREPDWLSEPRADDVLEQMRWFPIVTFWQLSADLAAAADVPPGHGHDYDTLPVDAWAAILPADGWTPADTAEVHRHLAERRGEWRPDG